ncbi:MAG TPA: adenylate kinase [Bryobacteraceae bacterium]|jgi:adenylate kinase
MARSSDSALLAGKAVVLFGPPGSGKGTQSKFLVAHFGIPQISTGDMLRDHIARGDAIGKAIQARMKAGSLVPDELVNELVRVRVAEPDCANGFILDGYPRTRQQAEELMGLLRELRRDEVVIHLVVDYNVIIARISGRRVCPKCGTLYNSTSRPPKLPGICDLDGEKLVVREDDREEVVRERLEAYDNQTRPLIEFFRSAGHRLIEVDASHGTPEAVFGKILDELQHPA